MFGKNQYANSSFVLLIKHESNYCYTWKRHHLLSNECSCQCCFFIIYLMFVIFLLSVAKHLESANTMFSFIWWIIGFYWVSAGGQDLAQDSPQLYWFALSQSLSFWLLTFILINNSFVIHSSFGYSTLSSILFDPVYMLRRLCIIFLGFDVVFVVFCVALACIIGIAVCCCLPCIIAILYAVADQVCWISLSRCVLVFKIL